MKSRNFAASSGFLVFAVATSALPPKSLAERTLRGENVAPHSKSRLWAASGIRKAPPKLIAVVWAYQRSAAYFVDLTELFWGTYFLAKKLLVKSTALRPASESIAGVTRSSARKRPSASNNQLSQRVTPLPCQL